jgi:hypothetical protein
MTMHAARAAGLGLLALMLAACGAEAPSVNDQAGGSVSRPAPAPHPTPLQIALASGANANCACKVHGQCVVLEEIFGNFEIRNLSCTPVNPDRGTVSCNFERRFVELTYPERPRPFRWEAANEVFTHYAPGAWCGGEP